MRSYDAASAAIPTGRIDYILRYFGDTPGTWNDRGNATGSGEFKVIF